MITKIMIEKWLQNKETNKLEFKKAANQFSKEQLVNYCIAFANEKGGQLILGITDKIPRTVVGTTAFPDILKIQRELIDTIKLRIEIEEYIFEGKRILIFSIPSRPIATPLEYKGQYWMRVGESLMPMTPDQLKKIYAEAVPDFSSSICENAVIDDLSDIALDNFRKLWFRKTGNKDILESSFEKLLIDAELFDGRYLNYAALVLLGSHKSLGKYLANNEIVFEYRSKEGNIEYQQRKDFREGFFTIHNEIWELINLRNEVQQIREGFFIRDIPNFNEEVVREAILNAVCHRDYSLQGSIFIKQYPETIVIESPGGFPIGISQDNILFKNNPRNRRIAEVLQKCGLVERSGQGIDKMYRFLILESKPKPDFSRSDDYQVNLSLKSNIQDKQFLLFLERILNEKEISLTAFDLITLDEIRQGNHPSEEFKNNILKLKELGIIELYGRGKGRKYIITKKFYSFIGEEGRYTKIVGLDLEEKKALIIKHIKNFGKGTYGEFEQIFPALNRNQINNILKSLKKEQKIIYKGTTRIGVWILK